VVAGPPLKLVRSDARTPIAGAAHLHHPWLSTTDRASNGVAREVRISGAQELRANPLLFMARMGRTVDLRSLALSRQ